MQKKNKKVFAFLLLLALAFMAVPFAKSRAAGTALTIEAVNYEAETITVKSTNDSFLYYSDEKRKKWECAGAFESGSFTMDISWVSKTKDYVLVLKGDKSDEVSVTLPKQDKSFKAKYNFKDEVLTYEGEIQNRTISWRKADSIAWETVKMAADGKHLAPETLEAFQRLYARGATLYFRLEQVSGNGTNAGKRPSKEVKLSLSKQASAPNLALKLPGTVTVNDKQEYKLETDADWTTVSGKTLEIAEIATAAYGTSAKETKILVRVAATEKKLPSATATVTVLAQEAAPERVSTENGTEKGSVDIGFANASTLLFTFKEVKSADGEEVLVEKPSSKNPYEYTIVEAGEQLKDDAKWTAITSEKVQISKEKAPQGATVHVRKKGRVESALVWQPESASLLYVVNAYPQGGTLGLATDSNSNAVSINGEGVLSIIKEEGAPAQGLKFNITLADKEFNEKTDVKEITCGGKQLTFQSTKTGNTICVEITDTSAYEKAVTVRDKEQDVKITLKNGEVIEKAKLTILSGAKVKVKGKQPFTVTHGLSPEESYEFEVTPGLTFPKNGDEYSKTKVTDVIFEGESIDYQEEKQSDGSYKITLKTAAFDEFFEKDIKLDEEKPLTIVMSNGQKVTEGIGIELHEDVKRAEGNPIVRIMTEGGILAEEGKELVYKLTCTKDLNIVGIVASWNNQNIVISADIEKDGEVILKLGATAFQKLTLTPGQTAETAPIIFTITRKDGKTSTASQIYWLTLQKPSAP